MSHNLTAVTQGNTTMLTFTQGVNEVLMKGMLGYMILLGLWFVIFTSIMLATQDGTKAMLTSGFIIFSIALGLFAVGLVGQIAIYVPLIVTAIMVAVSWGK